MTHSIKVVNTLPPVYTKLTRVCLIGDIPIFIHQDQIYSFNDHAGRTEYIIYYGITDTILGNSVSFYDSFTISVSYGNDITSNLGISKWILRDLQLYPVDSKAIDEGLLQELQHIRQELVLNFFLLSQANLSQKSQSENVVPDITDHEIDVLRAIELSRKLYI